MSSDDPIVPVAVLDRLSAILDVLEGHGRLTLSQIARNTQMPRSSVHRMLINSTIPGYL